MKHLSIFIFLIQFSLLAYSQEFMGVKVEGKKKSVVRKFKSKGFLVISDKGDGLTTLLGTEGDVEILLSVVYSPISKTVWKFAVNFPERPTWDYLLNDYEKYLNVLINKYGQPDTRGETFKSPYSLGDGNELIAVAKNKSVYGAVWMNKFGIGITITEFLRVKIDYENLVNSELAIKEQKSMDSKNY